MKKAIQFISVSDGQKLSGTLVLPERPLAMVCIFHGMVEHRGRYQMFADELANESLAVMLIDQRGHGESLYDGHIKGHFSDSDGWNRNLRDLHDFIQQTNEPYNLPIFIFAHSMGTLFARSYLKRYESAIDGIYMTGCVAQNPNANFAMVLARISVFFFGKRRPNRFLLDQTFATFNRHIDHPVTAFDWLSYDTRNVNAYIQDDLCGFPLSNQGFVDLFELTEDAYSAEGWRVMRPNLPIRFVSGTDDPVFLPGGLSESVRHLTDVGYRWVETRLIDGCRHEVLQEAKRDEVVADFLRWINYHLKNLNDIG